MKDPKLTKERIKEAGEKAEEDRKPLSGDVIQAIRNMNRAQNAKPLLEKLSNTDRAKLQKVVREKKKK